MNFTKSCYWNYTKYAKKNDLSTKGNKHELVRRIAEKKGEIEEGRFYPDYNGDPSSLPGTVANIRKFPIATLKYILKSHALSYCGNKDDLVLRVFLLSHKRVLTYDHTGDDSYCKKDNSGGS